MYSQRFKELRKALRKNQSEFAESLGLSKSFIAQIEIGDKIPSDRTLNDICRIHNVNKTWLETGEGNMFNELSWEDEVSSIVANLFEEKDEDDRIFKTELIKYISKMDTDQITMVRDMCRKLLKKEAD